MKYKNVPELEIQPGDQVRCTNDKAHEAGPDYFPKTGTVGTVIVVTDSNDTAVIRWPDGATKYPEAVVPIEWLAFVSREGASA